MTENTTPSPSDDYAVQVLVALREQTIAEINQGKAQLASLTRALAKVAPEYGGDVVVDLQQSQPMHFEHAHVAGPNGPEIVKVQPQPVRGAEPATAEDFSSEEFAVRPPTHSTPEAGAEPVVAATEDVEPEPTPSAEVGTAYVQTVTPAPQPAPTPAPVLTAQENAQQMPGEEQPPWAAQAQAAAEHTGGRRTNEQIATELGVRYEDVKRWKQTQGGGRVTKADIEEFAKLARQQYEQQRAAQAQPAAAPAPAAQPQAAVQSAGDFDEPVVSAPPARPAEPSDDVPPETPQPMTSATPFKPPF